MLPSYKLMQWQHQAEINTQWCYMHPLRDETPPDYRPCFSPPLIDELERAFTRCASEAKDELLTHMVMASGANEFNLGGDLNLFSRLIREKNENDLRHYAYRCVKCLHDIHHGFGKMVHTIALVQGSALGGGFEAALSCSTLVAERGVKMGFPEVMFGLFPGMGAYSFLRQRLNSRQAEVLLSSGTIYLSEDLYQMGVIDVLAEPGEGREAVQTLIRQHRRIPHARRAIDAARAITHPVTLDELISITDLWVKAAISLDEKHLRTMERLVRAQNKKMLSGDFRKNGNDKNGNDIEAVA